MTIGTITSGKRFFRHTKQGSIRDDVLRFPEYFLNHVAGQVIVVLDNAGVHHSKTVRASLARYERLSLAHRPPYAPELNPIELVWVLVKRSVLGNCCLCSLEALKAKLVRAWQRV